MKKFLNRSLILIAMIVGLSVASHAQKGPKKPPPKDPPPVVTPQPKLPPQNPPPDSKKPKKPRAVLTFIKGDDIESETETESI